MIGCTEPQREAYGWQRDGGHAPFLLTEARTLVHLPDALTYLDGAMVACGLGTSYAACLRANISGRDNVLITGLGPVGIGTALLCRAMGARVVGIEAVAERRQLAARLGFGEIIAPDQPVSMMLEELTNGNGVEVAIECSGNPDARRLCLEAARPWARVVFVGEGNTVSFEPSPLLIHKQLSLHGSWVCSLPQMQELVELLVRWTLHPDAMVTHRFSLEEGWKAYETFDTGGTGKVAIIWED